MNGESCYMAMAMAMAWYGTVLMVSWSHKNKRIFSISLSSGCFPLDYYSIFAVVVAQCGVVCVFVFVTIRAPARPPGRARAGPEPERVARFSTNAARRISIKTQVSEHKQRHHFYKRIQQHKHLT